MPVFVRDLDTTRSLWKQPGRQFTTGLAVGPTRLTHLIHQFEGALRGTPPAQALALQGRIRASASKHELWDLRSEVHALVKQAFDAWEAQSRLAELDGLFDSSGPRGTPFPV